MDTIYGPPVCAKCYGALLSPEEAAAADAKEGTRLDADEAKLNVEDARRLVEAACGRVCRLIEGRIRDASKSGLRSIGDPFGGLGEEVTDEMRKLVRSEFTKRGFKWKHGSSQKDGDWDVVLW